jgi:hypothetical protein
MPTLATANACRRESLVLPAAFAICCAVDGAALKIAAGAGSDLVGFDDSDCRFH